MQAGQIFQQRYRIGQEIGRGSFGIVYLADDLQSGGMVAIKVLLPWVRHDEGLRHRLKREAKLTQMLSSPHAVRVYDLDETPDGDLFIVMEYLDGDELTTLLHREGRLRPERAADIGRQALHALGEAHRLGVIHRDLKPHNILVCQSGSGRDFAKLLDFGIAKVAGSEDGSGVRETTRLTRPGNILGTPAYMSPEQCQGESLTTASDFYSLGVVMYEMLTGRPPFDDVNPVQILVMHSAQQPPPLPAALAELPIGKAIMRALEKDPQARFRTAEEFSAAIVGRSTQSLDSTKAAGATAVTTATQSQAPRPSAQPSPIMGEGERAPVGRGFGGVLRRFWLPLMIAALLAILGASVWLTR